jgi:polar amino acid transport system substrate-binding protein
MRPTRLPALAALALLAAACSSGGGASLSPSAAPTASSSVASPSASVEPSPSVDACAKESLATKTAGKLTVGTDNPAFPPYFLPREGGNTDPWDPSQGDPTTGTGFESAVAYAIADELGFSSDEVTWVVVPFANSFAPGPKDFDFNINQVSFKEERTQTADLSEGYYFGNQAVVVNGDGDFANATTVTELKAAKLGAQVGTTSLDAIENVIQPTAPASVYDTNDAAIQALQAKQIHGIVVDVPTGFFITFVQAEGTKMIGQLAEATGAQPQPFSLVLQKDSPITDCVNAAIVSLRDKGTLDALKVEWLDDEDVPELQP